MKKQAFGILTMFSLLLVVTAASVHAQSKRSSINIPFNFNVGQRTLPAGEYTVEPLRKDSHTVWLVENRSQHASVLFTTTAAWTRETPEETKLVFNRYDNQNFLSQIWIAGDNSGRQLQRRQSELQLAKNGIQPEKVFVTLADGE
jgi:hypothetical protein